MREIVIERYEDEGLNEIESAVRVPLYTASWIAAKFIVADLLGDGYEWRKAKGGVGGYWIRGRTVIEIV